MNSGATQNLSTVDPVMRPMIRAIGPFALKSQISVSPSEPLAREVTYQQLHDRAVESS